MNTNSLPPPITTANRGRAFMARRVARACALAALLVTPLSWAQTTAPSRVINLSVRSKLAPGESLITGFIVDGSEPARVLVRGIGPTLLLFGVNDAMPNPKISLTKIAARGSISVHNDDWSPGSILAEAEGMKQLPTTMEGAFPLEPSSRDAAMLVELAPGAYTLTVSGSSASDAGTVLAEVYDTRTAPEVGTTRLINLSVRGTAGPGVPLFGGFVVSGTAPKRMLLRVSGPALTAFGVAGAAADTRLDLMNDKGAVIRSNDNWDTGDVGEMLELRQAALFAGAFPFVAGSRDAATVVTLPPGLYTLRGSGVDGVSGVVLLEMYELPAAGEIRPINP